MSPTTVNELLRDLFSKLNSLLNISGDSHSSAVCLRAENKHFRVYPDQCGSFRTAVTALNPHVSIKGRTSAVLAVLANSDSEAKEIRLDGMDYIPIVSSFVELSNVDSSQCATLVRGEDVLVVWSDSEYDVVDVFQTFEHRLQHLSKLCYCNTISPVLQAPDSPVDSVGKSDGRLFATDPFLFGLEWPETRPNPLPPLDELSEMRYLIKSNSPGIDARDPLDALSSSLCHMDDLSETFPCTDVSPSETLYSLSSSSSSGFNLSTCSSSGMSLSPAALAHTPAMAISPMLTVSPMLTISPTITIPPASPSSQSQAQPSKLQDWDDDAALDAASFQDIADILQGSPHALEQLQSSTPAYAYAGNGTLSPAAQTVSLPDVEQVGLATRVSLLPPRRTHGRAKSTSSAASVASSSRLLSVATRPMSVPRTSFASGSSAPDGMSPLSRSTSGRDGHVSLARFHATTSALGSYAYASEGPSSRVVGQKSKRAQYDDGSEEEDGRGQADDEGAADADDEIDELGEDDYDDNDDEDDDDEYVEEAYSSRPSVKRARSSASASASASTSTAPPPQKKARTRRRKTTASKKQRFACPHCRETFSRNTDLKRHASGAKCTGGQKNASTCEFCPKEFLRPDALKRHKRTVHRDIFHE